MESAQDFAHLQLQFVDQIQWRYELIRPLVSLDKLLSHSLVFVVRTVWCRSA